MTNSWSFKIGYYTLILVFSSLSVSAVLHATTFVYLGHEVTFKKVLNDAIFKVWKGVMITSLCSYVSIAIYINFFQPVLQWVLFFPHYLCYRLPFGCKVITVSYTYNESRHWSDQIHHWINFLFNIGFISLLMLLFAIGLLYIIIVWQMASVVSVLEDKRNVLKAVIKSQALIKGKVLINTTIFLTTFLLVVFIREEYGKLSVGGHSLMDLISGILCFWFLCQVILHGLAVQTMAYFVCKSCRHEIIQPSDILDSLQLHSHNL